jgi:hypothetical protein
MVVETGNGAYLFRVFDRQAAAVCLAGDFTGWDSGGILMTDDGGGWWSARICVPPGDHLFSYLVGGVEWRPDYAANGIRRNGYGGWVSCLIVPEVAACVVEASRRPPLVGGLRGATPARGRRRRHVARRRAWGGQAGVRAHVAGARVSGDPRRAA